MILSNPSRLAALRETGLMDAPPDEAIDRFTRLAGRVLGAPVALATLVDENRGFFTSCVGLPESLAASRQAPLSHSICRHVVESGDALVVSDARGHPLLRENGAVVQFGMVAYAGVPLIALRGEVLGSLCAIDFRPRAWTPAEVEILRDLGAAVVLELERRAESTRRKLVERALSGSETRFRSVVESAGDAIIVSDASGAIAGWNAGARKIFGYEADEVLGRSVDLLVPAAYHDARHGWGDRLARISEPPLAGRTTEIEGVRADGSVFPMEASLSRWREGDEEFFGAVVRDITERRAAEEALRASESHFRAIFDEATVGMAMVDPAGIPVRTNRALQEMLGRTGDELARVGFNAITHPDDMDRDRDAIRDLNAGLLPHFSVEKRYRHSDGSTVWGKLTISVVRGDAGEVLFSIGMVENVTERKKAEARLEQSQGELRQSQKMEAVGRLAGGVAHDFNNLLTVISGNSEFLIESVPADDEATREPLAEILSASRRAAQLTSQLLAFSRGHVTEVHRLELNPVVAEAEKLLRRLIGEDVELVIRLCNGRPALVADAGHLGQVLVNLAVNARDAMPAGGRLTITTHSVRVDVARDGAPAEPGDYALLEVADTGTGMNAETVARIFDPFFTTKPVGKGTGLGLSTVYGIVKQAGGQLFVDSKVGRGTAFRIFFPMAPADAEAAPPAEQRARARDAAAETVLLVEDDASVRRFVGRVLRRAGYRVLEASCGAEALAVVAEHPAPIPIALTDVVMPGMSGPQLADELVARRPEMRVLFMSGYNEDAIVRHGVAETGNTLIQKPFYAADLLRAVRAEIERPA